MIAQNVDPQPGIRVTRLEKPLCYIFADVYWRETKPTLPEKTGDQPKGKKTDELEEVI